MGLLSGETDQGLCPREGGRRSSSCREELDGKAGGVDVRVIEVEGGRGTGRQDIEAGVRRGLEQVHLQPRLVVEFSACRVLKSSVGLPVLGVFVNDFPRAQQHAKQ